jgi:hypothetical protein
MASTIPARTDGTRKPKALIDNFRQKMARVVDHCRRCKIAKFCPANNSSLIAVVGHSGLVVKAGNRIIRDVLKGCTFYQSVVITSRMQSLGCLSLQRSAPDKPDLSFSEPLTFYDWKFTADGIH